MQVTISEAIRRVHKLKNEIATLRTRVDDSVTYMEKDPPAFAFEESMKALIKAQADLVFLTTAIAESNAKNTVSIAGTNGGSAQVSVAGALRMLSELKSEIAWVKNLGHRSTRLRETETVSFTESEEQETVEFLGRATHRPKRVRVVTKTICNLTTVEHAERLKALQDTFDTINNIVESSNHLNTVQLP